MANRVSYFTIKPPKKTRRITFRDPSKYDPRYLLIHLSAISFPLVEDPIKKPTKEKPNHNTSQ